MKGVILSCWLGKDWFACLDPLLLCAHPRIYPYLKGSNCGYATNGWILVADL